MTKSCFLMVAFAGVLMAAPVQAGYQPIAVYSTGVDNSGNVLAGGALDQHYTLSTTTAIEPNFTAPNAYVVGTPNSAWVANDSTSRWINALGYAGNENNGMFTYTTTFSLAGFAASTASIMGKISADDQVSVLLNGKSTGISITNGSTNYGATSPNGAYSQFYNISITSGFTSGLNTLTFLEANTATGPAGLRTELTGTANVVPEPASLAMVGLGLGAVGFVARRRRRA